MAQKTIQCVREKECKHSVRFAAVPAPGETNPVIDTLYVNRPHADSAKTLTVTIDIAG